MKNIVKKVAFISGLILISSPFISCNKNELKPESIKASATTHKALALHTSKKVIARAPIVFIAGFDTGNETYYSNARNYFKEKGLKVVDGQYSLEEIITWLNENALQNPYGEIHIVNKSNPYKGMNLETIIRGTHVNTTSLQNAINKGTLPVLKDVVNTNTKIIFHASGLTENTQLLQTLKKAFTSKQTPKVIASAYHTVFGGKFSNHYLAQPYYVFYPTAKSPGITDLSKEIAKKYPEEKDINWFDALNNEEERYVGEAYSTQFSIPIKWKFDYLFTDEEIPTFTMPEEVMDWIEQQQDLMAELNAYNIPIDKYRWTWSVKDTTLIIRGRTTVVCVLKPLIKPYGDLEHIEPDTNNKRLYGMK